MNLGNSNWFTTWKILWSLRKASYGLPLWVTPPSLKFPKPPLPIFLAPLENSCFLGSLLFMQTSFWKIWVCSMKSNCSSSIKCKIQTCEYYFQVKLRYFYIQKELQKHHKNIAFSVRWKYKFLVLFIPI